MAVDCKECLCYETDVCLACKIQTENYEWGKNYYEPNKFIKQIQALAAELEAKEGTIDKMRDIIKGLSNQISRLKRRGGR